MKPVEVGTAAAEGRNPKAKTSRRANKFEEESQKIRMPVASRN
jgi:hypothetical protein